MRMMYKMMGCMMDSMSSEDKEDSMMKMMPMMMKRIRQSDIADLMSRQFMDMMIVTYPSRYGFDETIVKVQKAGQDAGWFNPDVRNHEEMEKSLGLENPNRVATVARCIPRAAAKILKTHPGLAVMMPMQINIYEEGDSVFVCWMNIGMMGKMFGGEVAKIMGDSSGELLKTLGEIIPKEEDNSEGEQR